MTRPNVQEFFDDATNTYSYVVWDPSNNVAAVIDSLLDFDQASGRTKTISADRLIAFVKDKGLTVDWIIERLPSNVSSCLGRSARLSGQNRVPDPPAIMTA